MAEHDKVAVARFRRLEFAVVLLALGGLILGGGPALRAYGVVIAVAYFALVDVHSGSAGERPNSAIERYLDTHTMGPILVAGFLGIAVAIMAFELFRWGCVDLNRGLCKVAANSPPWIVLTGLIAAPSAVLTWYWRTAHKKADLDHDAQEALLRREELDERERERQVVRDQTLVTEYKRALEALGAVREGGSNVAIDALVAVAKHLPSKRQEAADELARFVRRTGEIFDIAPQLLRALRGMSDLRAIGEVSEGPNLAAATLVGLNLGGLDLRGADLSEARLDGCNLVGTRLTDAQLRGCKAHGVVYDETTELSELGSMLLEMGGARTAKWKQEQENWVNDRMAEHFGESASKPTGESEEPNV